MHKKMRDSKGHYRVGGVRFSMGETVGDSANKSEPKEVNPAAMNKRGENKRNAMDYGKGSRERLKGYGKDRLLSPEDNDSL